MTKQRERFVDAYVRCLNGAKAAVDAGYSAKSARQRAYELLCDPEIKMAVNAKLQEAHLSWEEAAYRIGQTARSSLNDFLMVEEVIENRMVRRGLQELINGIQLAYDVEQDLFEELGLGTYVPPPKKKKGERTLEDEDEIRLHKLQDDHFTEQQERETDMRRYRIELRYNPLAYRDVMETVKVRKVIVDLEGLRDAESEGRIKKFSFDKQGRPQVELYPADRAQETVLKLAGKLPNKSEGDEPYKEVDLSGLSDEIINVLVTLNRQNRQQ